MLGSILGPPPLVCASVSFGPSAFPQPYRVRGCLQSHPFRRLPVRPEHPRACAPVDRFQVDWSGDPIAQGSLCECKRVLDVFIVPGTFPRLSMKVTRASAAADPQSLVSPDVLASNIVSYNGYCPRRLSLDDLERAASDVLNPNIVRRVLARRQNPSIAAPKGNLSKPWWSSWAWRLRCRLLVPQLIEQQICDLVVILVVPDRLALGRASAR